MRTTTSQAELAATRIPGDGSLHNTIMMNVRPQRRMNNSGDRTMKKIVAAAGLFSIISLYSATAQIKTVETTSTTDSTTGKTEIVTVSKISTTEDLTVRKHMIYLDPIKFFAFFNINYLYALNNNVALGGGIQTPTALLDYGYGNDDGVTGFGFNVEGRFYPSAKMFRGFHLSGNFSYNHVNYSDYDSDANKMTAKSADPTALGVALGWHWYPWDEFATEIAIGADYNMSPTEDPIPFINMIDARKGITPSLRFNIGYAW